MFRREKKEKKPKKPVPIEREVEEGVNEELTKKGLRLIDKEQGRAKLERDPENIIYTEKPGEDVSLLENYVLLKDGKRDGLIALVKIIEDVKVSQDHDANIESIGFSGKLNIENPSKKDRLWDINLVLKNIETTSLPPNEIKIQELGVTENDNIKSHEFKIEGEAKNLLLVKEYISTLPNADEILNIRDIETNLLNLKDKTAKAEEIAVEEEAVEEEEKKEEGEEEEEEEEEEKEEEEEEEEEGNEEPDGGVAAEEFTLESFGISLDKEFTVTFAIGIRSLFEKPLYNIVVKKTILEHFTNPKVIDTTIGYAEIEGEQLTWKIDVLKPEKTVLLKFTCNIMVSELEAKNTGEIEVTFEASSSFVPGLGIDTFDAFTRNKFHVDIMERDEEPGIWDCKLVFENSSEFMIELFNIDVYRPEDKSTNYAEIESENFPLLPPGAQWHSSRWNIESEDYPQFRKNIEFRVLPDFQTSVNSTILIKDVELVLASIKGELTFDVAEIELPVEEEEGIIKIPTYKDTDINAVLTVHNDGSAPLNEVKITHQPFSDQFQPPNLEETVDEETGEKIPPEVQVLKDGKPVEIQPGDLRIDDDALIYEVKDLKDRPEGMFDPNSVYELKYPIHASKPVEDVEFESEVLINANTYPIGPELEYRVIPEEVPVIKAVHLRRQYRLGKEIIPLGNLGEYQIVLYLKNIGTTHMPLKNFKILDKVPDNFERSNFSMEPEIIDMEGEDILQWTIETLEEGEELEISYQIKGKGEYQPSKVQLAY